jgi:T-complex protein 1 subunit eta
VPAPRTRADAPPPQTRQTPQVGGERYNLFRGCPQARTATIVLRGGSEQFIDEADRSLHDAIMIVRRALKHASVVPGGGAIDMELSRVLRDYAR